MRWSAAVVVLFCLISEVGLADAREAYESSYQPRPVQDVLIKGATVLTGTGERLDNTDVHLSGGRIAAIGSDLPIQGAEVVHGSGRWLTPGIIDVHSHLGDYPAPAIASTRDGNEITDPNTSQVWAEHSVWPQDPQFPLALAGGVTTLQILPGSANLFGGRGVTLKNVPSRTVQDMKFPGAKQSLKMACGENPKRLYGSRDKAPFTRMGNIAGFRDAWAKARYTQELRRVVAEKIAAGEPLTRPPPVPDLGIDTLIGVLEGEILVHNHCY